MANTITATALILTVMGMRLASHPEPQDNVDWRRAGFMRQIVDDVKDGKTVTAFIIFKNVGEMKYSVPFAAG
jgi:hypothetical protein